MKVGIIRETKIPSDKRVPFTPDQIKKLQEQSDLGIEFQVQSSIDRAFSDEQFEANGIKVVDDISDCDVLFGVKEVAIDQLIANKTYFFFSHTIKKQPYNRLLLQRILEKNIRLIDYEVLKDAAGKRIVAFGRWAGIVGAYNAFWTYGKKTGLFDIKRAHECDDLEELHEELKKVQMPPVKIVVTGTGRVGQGMIEILQQLNIKEVSAKDFLNSYYEEPVYVVLSSKDYNKRKSDGGYDKQEFYEFPERYESDFKKIAETGEILLAGAFWDPNAPRLFELSDIGDEDFQLSVIADVSCDVNGGVPTTTRPTTIADPVYDLDRQTQEELPAFGKQNSISVMSIDNLPCELPKAASSGFGEQLIEWIIPELKKEHSKILEGATITRDGDLTLEYMYLKDYVYPNEQSK